MANKESNFNTATSLREYLNSKLITDTPKSIFLKITNINNVDAGPFSTETESTPDDLFRIGNIIHDAQLVWVGNQFYLQGRKIKDSGSSEEYSPTYLFPFDAISVEFIELVNNNTLYLDLNLQDGMTATLSESYKSGLVSGGESYTLPDSTKFTNITTGWSFAGWNTERDGTGTSKSGSYDFPNKITGVALYAQWTAPSA